MIEYINRQATIEALGDVPYVSDTWTDEYSIGEYHQYKKDKAAIESVPSEDVVPVRHGRWRDDDTCSECGEEPLTEYAVDIMQYCPNCGARMDGEL